MFFLDFAGERAYAAFTAGGGVLVAWIIRLAAAAIMVIRHLRAYVRA